MQITVDTNILPIFDILEAAKARGYELAYVSTTGREAEDFEQAKGLRKLEMVKESAVFGESQWGNAKIGSPRGVPSLNEILSIISSGSLLLSTPEKNDAQCRQVRDAMILHAHAREHRDIFVTDDKRGFISHGRREELEDLCSTKILTRREFEEKLGLR